MLLKPNFEKNTNTSFAVIVYFLPNELISDHITKAENKLILPGTSCPV